MLTTGQIVFAVGLAGLAASLIATIVTTKNYRKNEKKLREDICRFRFAQPWPHARNPATPPPTRLPTKIRTFEVLLC